MRPSWTCATLASETRRLTWQRASRFNRHAPDLTTGPSTLESGRLLPAADWPRHTIPDAGGQFCWTTWATEIGPASTGIENLPPLSARMVVVLSAASTFIYLAHSANESSTPVRGFGNGRSIRRLIVQTTAGIGPAVADRRTVPASFRQPAQLGRNPTRKTLRLASP